MVTGKDILVVDDEAPIRALWERFLARWGYSFDSAQNGQEALKLARVGRYLAVVTDLTMPVMTGNELIYILRQEQPDLEIVVTTGYGTVEIAVELMKAGIFDFITKPISFNHAEIIVRKCIEKIKAGQETARLREVNRDLERLNQVKEKFLAITNHELRTPVSVLSSVLDLLSEELRGHAVEPILKMADSSTRQLAEIVGQMHDISGAKSNRLELRPSVFLFKPLCEEVLEEFSLALRERKHALAVQVPDEFTLAADRGLFKKVVRELVQNAVKFTPDGGTIVLSVAREGAEQVVFSVQDSGIGIPAEEHTRIFELFYEVGDSLHHHSSRDQFMGGGMGVGLSIVNDIVTAHRGEVRVASAPGSGSTFSVVLPLRPAHAAEP